MSFTTSLDVTGIAVAALAALLVLARGVMFRREIRRAVKDHSRFKLFAVRDRLVILAATGTLSEKNPAWRHVYQSVNALLGMHKRLDIHDVIQSLVNYMIALAQDKALQERSAKINEQLEREAVRTPEFAALRLEMNQAFMHLIRRRSGLIAALRVKVYLLRWRVTLALRTSWSAASKLSFGNVPLSAWLQSTGPA